MRVRGFCWKTARYFQNANTCSNAGGVSLDGGLRRTSPMPSKRWWPDLRSQPPSVWGSRVLVCVALRGVVLCAGQTAGAHNEEYCNYKLTDFALHVPTSKERGLWHSLVIQNLLSVGGLVPSRSCPI